MNLQPPETTIFIGGIGGSVKDQDIKDYFRDRGNTIRVFSRPGVGYAFLTFGSAREVTQIVKDRFHFIRGCKVEMKRNDASQRNRNASKGGAAAAKGPTIKAEFTHGGARGGAPSRSAAGPSTRPPAPVNRTDYAVFLNYVPHGYVEKQVVDFFSSYGPNSAKIHSKKNGGECGVVYFEESEDMYLCLDDHHFKWANGEPFSAVKYGANASTDQPAPVVVPPAAQYVTRPSPAPSPASNVSSASTSSHPPPLFNVPYNSTEVVFLGNFDVLQHARDDLYKYLRDNAFALLDGQRSIRNDRVGDRAVVAATMADRSALQRLLKRALHLIPTKGGDQIEILAEPLEDFTTQQSSKGFRALTAHSSERLLQIVMCGRFAMDSPRRALEGYYEQFGRLVRADYQPSANIPGQTDAILVFDYAKIQPSQVVGTKFSIMKEVRSVSGVEGAIHFVSLEVRSYKTQVKYNPLAQGQSAHQIHLQKALLAHLLTLGAVPEILRGTGAELMVRDDGGFSLSGPVGDSIPKAQKALDHYLRERRVVDLTYDLPCWFGLGDDPFSTIRKDVNGELSNKFCAVEPLLLKKNYSKLLTGSSNQNLDFTLNFAPNLGLEALRAVWESDHIPAFLLYCDKSGDLLPDTPPILMNLFGNLDRGFAKCLRGSGYFRGRLEDVTRDRSLMEKFPNNPHILMISMDPEEEALDSTLGDFGNAIKEKVSLCVGVSNAAIFRSVLKAAMQWNRENVSIDIFTESYMDFDSYSTTLDGIVVERLKDAIGKIDIGFTKSLMHAPTVGEDPRIALDLTLGNGRTRLVYVKDHALVSAFREMLRYEVVTVPKAHMGTVERLAAEQLGQSEGLKSVRLGPGLALCPLRQIPQETNAKFLLAYDNAVVTSTILSQMVNCVANQECNSFSIFVDNPCPNLMRDLSIQGNSVTWPDRVTNATVIIATQPMSTVQAHLCSVDEVWEQLGKLAMEQLSIGPAKQSVTLHVISSTADESIAQILSGHFGSSGALPTRGDTQTYSCWMYPFVLLPELQQVCLFYNVRMSISPSTQATPPSLTVSGKSANIQRAKDALDNLINEWADVANMSPRWFYGEGLIWTNIPVVVAGSMEVLRKRNAEVKSESASELSASASDLSAPVG